MESVSIEQRTFSDKSKACYLHFWSNEGEIFHSMRITKKQFDELKKKGFEISTFDPTRL